MHSSSFQNHRPPLSTGSDAVPILASGVSDCAVQPRLIGATSAGASSLGYSQGAGASESHAAAPLRDRIDAGITSLRTLSGPRLDAELGDRLRRFAPLSRVLCVFQDHACSGLDVHAPRVHGDVGQELLKLYSALIVERDPMLQRAIQEGRPITGTIDEHVVWLRQNTRNADVLCAWLDRFETAGERFLAVIPAKGWLSRGALYVFHADPLDDAVLFTLGYAAQRLAQALELRDRPYLSDLLNLRFTAREGDVLRAGLRGEADESIGARLGLSVDAIRYYFKKFKHRVPVAIGHLKPRELARILNQLGKL